jgi:hypothetical protein
MNKEEIKSDADALYANHKEYTKQLKPSQRDKIMSLLKGFKIVGYKRNRG